ncbi:MAG: hypothetical protein NXI20_13500, partial [bacterium]|nr:hypothetical protein [bacterium]
PTQTAPDAGLFLQADGVGGVSYAGELDGDPNNEIELPTQTAPDAGLFLQADGVGGVSYAAELDGDPNNEIELPTQTAPDTNLPLIADGVGGVSYTAIDPTVALTAGGATTGQRLEFNGTNWGPVNAASFSTLNAIPKGDGAGGQIASDIFSDATNQVTIGIPTTLPNVKFAVVNQSTNLNFGGANFSDTPGQGANFAVLRSRGTPGGEGVLQSNDAVGVFAYNVWDGTSDFISVASMRVDATANHTAGSNYGSQFTIATIANGTSSEQDRFRIQGDGTIVLNDNTAIGAGPTTGAKLQINPDNGQVNALRINPEGGGSNTGELQWMDLGSNFVGFRAPNTVVSNTVWTLPDDDGGLDDVLATNGLGELYWRTPGVFDSDLEFVDGSIRTIYVAQPSTGPGNDLVIHAGDAANTSGADGGDLYLSGGLQDGGGLQGEVFIDGPTTIGSGSPLGASFFFDSGTEYNNTTVTATTVQGDGSTVSVSKASGTIASEATVTGGDNLGSFAWLGYDGTDYQPAAFITGTALENYSTTGFGASLLIHTVPLGSTAPAPIVEINDGGIEVFERGGVPGGATFFSDNGNAARISTPAGLPGPMDFVLPPSEGANGETLTSDGSGGTYWASSSAFSASNEVPRGDGGGQVSSNIFSDGFSVLVGSNDFALGQNFGVVNEGSPLRTAFVNYSSTAADDASSLGFVRARGSAAIPASPQLNDRLGAIEFNTYISSITDAAQIIVNATENHNPNGGVEMLFRTSANGQNSPQDRMRIDQNGDVEIATSLNLGPMSVDNLGNITAANNADFGDVTLRRSIINQPDPAVVDADVTLVIPSDHKYVRVESPGGGGALNEIVGAVDGQEIIIVNIGTGNVVIESLGSAAVNILLNNDTQYTMTPRSTLHLMYVGGTINNWIEIGRAAQP